MITLEEVLRERAITEDEDLEGRRIAADIAARAQAMARQEDEARQRLEADREAEMEATHLKAELMQALTGKTMFPADALTIAIRLAGALMQDQDWTNKAIKAADSAYCDELSQRAVFEDAARTAYCKCIAERVDQDRKAAKYLAKLAESYKANADKVIALKTAIEAAVEKPESGYLFEGLPSGDPPAQVKPQP